MGASAGDRPARVVLIDDHLLVLSGLRNLLDETPGFMVVDVFVDGGAAMSTVSSQRPDLVVCDVRLTGRLGPDVCRDIVKVSPSTKVVMLSAVTDRRILRACLDEGAFGILVKTSSELDIVAALRRVLCGEVVVDPALDLDFARTRPDLRPSEYKVLRLMALGLSTQDIEVELGLTNSTVRSYTQALMERLDAHTRVQLLVHAHRQGLV